MQGPSDDPRNELERGLAEIWARALGLDRVGIHEDFFDLGGHSLIAIEMVAQMNEMTGLDILVADLTELRTVANLSEAIARAIGEHADPDTIARLAAEGPPSKGGPP